MFKLKPQQTLEDLERTVEVMKTIATHIAENGGPAEAEAARSRINSYDLALYLLRRPGTEP
jgi:hypothetical protein